MKKHRIKKWITWIAVVALLAGAGGGGYWWYRENNTAEASSGITYTQSRVTKGTITQSVAGSGSVEVSETDTALVSEAATVAEVLVAENDVVKKGDVLATFEGEDVSLSLSKAQLTLEQQKMTLETAQEKWKSLQISGAEQSELDAAEMSIRSAQLNIQQTELEIQDYQEKAKAPDPLVAPIDGTVTAVNIKPGDDVAARLEAFTIVNYDKLQMTISADELDITKLKVGQTANLTLDALSDQQITGTVTEISKNGTASNGVSTFPVIVTLNEIENVLPGMSGSVEIIIEQKDDALMVPVDAVETMGGRYFVRVPNDGTASAGTNSGTDSGESAEADEMPDRAAAAAGQGGTGAEEQASGDGSAAQNVAQSERTAASGASEEGAVPSGAPEDGAASSGAPEGGAVPGGAPAGFGGGGRGAGMGGMNQQNGEFTLKEITVGITTDSYVEVLSGLSEGDTVLIQIVSSTSTTQTGMMGGMGGMGGATVFPAGGAGFSGGGGGFPGGGGGGGFARGGQ